MTSFKKTLKRRSALIVCALLTTPMMLGCVSLSATPSVICEGTARATDAHAEALLAAGVPDAVVITGDTLIAQLDAGCGR